MAQRLGGPPLLVQIAFQQGVQHGQGAGASLGRAEAVNRGRRGGALGNDAGGRGDILKQRENVGAGDQGGFAALQTLGGQASVADTAADRGVPPVL